MPERNLSRSFGRDGAPDGKDGAVGPSAGSMHAIDPIPAEGPCAGHLLVEGVMGSPEALTYVVNEAAERIEAHGRTFADIAGHAEALPEILRSGGADLGINHYVQVR